MKKVILLSITGLFVFASFIALQVNAQSAETQLRPTQVVMQQRAKWLRAMGENLTAKNFDAIKSDAMALASQAGAVAEKQSGLAKELTLKLSTFATATADAAGAQNSDGVQTQLNAVKGVCGECHAKFRNK